MQTIDFLQCVHAHTPDDALIGLTQINGFTVSTQWYKPPAIAHIVAAVAAVAPTANLFIRITPLIQPPHSGRGFEKQSLGASVLWCDIDAYAADQKEQIIEQLHVLPKPPTMIVDSGNGLHAYWLLDRFYTDLEAIKARNKQIRLDINHTNADKLADSCFDLARIMRVPGSLNHKSDPPKPCTILEYDPKIFYTLNDFVAAEVQEKAISVWDLQPLPEDFLDQIRERDPKAIKRMLDEETAKKAGAALKADGSIDRSRNDAFVATRLISLGFDPALILAALCNPEWLIGQKTTQTGRYDYALRTVNSTLQAFQASNSRYFANKKFVAQRLATELNTQHNYIFTGEKLWTYEHGVYLEGGERHVKEETIKRLKDRWSARASDDTLRWVMDQAYVDIEHVNAHKGLINVANGMLDITTGVLRPHSPSYLSLAQIPHVFAEDVDPCCVDQFVASILPADAIDFFWEFIGSALIIEQYWPKAFLVLYGSGDTGKSKLLEWIGRLYGQHNIRATPFQTLADNKFAAASLFGKIANIFSDLSQTEANNPDFIKTLTGDDVISGERKFKDWFEFKNTARLIYSANHYPKVKNPDEAYFRRAHIIHCVNVFTSDTANRNIVDDLSMPQHFSAGLLRAFQGLQRLLRQKAFSKSETLYRTDLEYRFSADSVAGFLDLCEADPLFAISKQDFYQAYRQMCSAGNRRVVSNDMFFKRVAENLDRFGITEQHKSVGDGRQWFYIGRKPPQTIPFFINIGAN